MDNRFREYLEDAAGKDAASVFMEALAAPASVSVRVNPFKSAHLSDREEVGRHFGVEVSSVPWCSCGYYLGKRPEFTLDPYLHAGAYYVQDSSSMFVGHTVRECLSRVEIKPASRPFRVLDLCAAPGGKTTDLAASLRSEFGDSFLLVSNEVMKTRAGVLADNVALWGDPNVMVTNADPAAFSSLPGFFDMIIADVPCSGEGMFRKDSGAVEQWSVENVSLCQARQRRIVADVWPSLAEGGIMIYSTCTFNRYEDDCNAEWICSALGAEKYPLWKELPHEWKIISTEYGSLLVPGLVSGEGQYCAAVRKISAVNGRVKQRQKTGWSRESVPDMFRIPMKYILKGGLVIAVPEAVAEDVMTVESCVRTISTGCAVGEKKGTVTVPSADLALDIMLDEGAFCAAELDLEKALAFLHRDTICLEDSPKGYVKVCYDGLPLGFVKNLGSRCNNMLPQGRRIRMDVRLAGKSGR